MNKIYKVVWSKAKHCYVVTSELAKRQTKGCGARSLRMATVSLSVAASLLCAGAVLPIFGESVAEAKTTTEKQGNKIINTTTDYTTVFNFQYPEKSVTIGATEINEVTNAHGVFGNVAQRVGQQMTDNVSFKVIDGQLIEIHDVNQYYLEPYQRVLTGHPFNFSNGTDSDIDDEIKNSDGAKSDVTGYSLTITGGTLQEVAGGLSNGGNVSNNTININDGTINKAVYGGYTTQSGNVSNNTVNLNGGIIKGTVYGGYSEDGVAGGSTAAEGNKVNITGGKVNSFFVYGGYSQNSNANFNAVTISGGEFWFLSSVYGGSSNQGNASNNSVSVSGGSLNDISGGSGNGNADNNTVTVTGGTMMSVNGGRSVNGTANNNTIDISGGTIGSSDEGGSVVGAYHAGGGAATANNNKINIYKNANIIGNVAGAKDNYGYALASGNTITIDGSAVVTGNVAGVSGWGADKKENKVFIKNGSVTGDVYGGLLDYNAEYKGNLIKNEVNISGGTVTGDVYGGAVKGNVIGDVKENKVNITGGTLTGDVYGGVSASGNAQSNEVNISGGTLNGKIIGYTQIGSYSFPKYQTVVYGGYVPGSNESSEVTGNKVTIESGEFHYTTVYGGCNKAGKAENNTVNITGLAGTSSISYVYGGSAVNKDVTKNEVNIGGGKVDNEVYGGYTETGTAGGSSEEGNKVTITGGTVDAAYGGYSKDGGDAINNIVTISGSAKVGTARGGYSSSGTVSNNTVTVNGGRLSYADGGFSSDGTANGNTVNITGGKVGGGVYGGDGDAATYNAVTISGDAEISAPYLTGGRSYKNSGGGVATGNTFTIRGGTFSGVAEYSYAITGGFTDQNGTAKDNAVNLTGEVTGLENFELYGYSHAATHSGNELHIGGTKTYDSSGTATVSDGDIWQGKSSDGTLNNKVESVSKFETIVLHNVAWSTTTPVLEAATVENVTTLDIKDMQFDQTPTNGESMALLKAGNDLGAGGVGIGLAYKDGSEEKTATSAELATGVTFDSGALTDTAVNGVSVTGTQSKKVSLENSNYEIRYAFSSTISGITIATDTFTAGGTARAFGSGDNLTGATITNNLAFSDESKNSMQSGESMVILDATNAVAVEGATLPAFTSASYDVNFSDAIDGKVVTLSGTHTDTLALNSSKTQLTYTVGDMQVSGAKFDGNVTWDDSASYYTADTKYKFSGTTNVNATGLKVTGTNTNALKVGDAMTLLSAENMTASITNDQSADNKTASKITVNYNDDTTNGIALGAEATGKVAVATNAVNYEVTGVEIQSVDLAGWKGTAVDVQSETDDWTVKSGASITTGELANAGLDAMNPGDVKTILTADTTADFSVASITGNKAWQAGGTITDTDTSGVSVTGTTTGGGVKVDDTNKNVLVYQKDAKTITGITLGSVAFTKDGTVRSFDNSYNLTGADFTTTGFSISNAATATMNAGDTMVIVDAVNAIKGTGDATLKDFTATNVGVTFTDAIEGTVLTLAGTRADTLEQNAAKTQIIFKVGDKNVETATFNGSVTWSDTAAHYTNDATKYKFNGATNIDATNLIVTGTTDKALKSGDVMTLLSADNMTASITNDQSAGNKTASKITVNFNDDTTKGIALVAEATGKVAVATNAVNYEVTGVEIQSVDLAGWTGTEADVQSETTGWTVKSGASITTGDLADAGLDTMDPGDVKPILTADTTADFSVANISGNKAWQDGGTITDTDTSGVTVAGTTTGGGVKVDDTNKNVLVYQKDAKTITGITLGSVAFTKDGKVRSFDNTYNLTGANFTTTGFGISNASTATMNAGDTMVIVDAVNAIKGTGDATLKDFTTTNAGDAIAFTDQIEGKALTLSGTHQDTLEQNEAKNQILYKVGDKNVTAAIFTGEVAWNDSEAYYTNDTSKYKIAATNVDATDLKVTGTSTKALQKGDAMTLFSAEGMTATLAKDQSDANKTANKITVNYSDATSGIGFGAEATGAVETAAGAVNYKVTGVTLNRVDLAGWNGTTSSVPGGWAIGDGATINTDGLAAPAVEPGNHVDILQNDTDNYFASATISGANTYQSTDFKDEMNGVTLEGKQDKGVTLNSEKKHLIYAAGTKNTASVSFGAVEWQKDATLADAAAGYDFTNVSEIGTDKFDVTYAKPEDVAINDSMTLLKANETLTAIVDELKTSSYKNYEIAPGVLMDGSITGTMSRSGNDVVFTATANQADKLTFTNVEWKDSGALLTRPANVMFAGADVDTAKINFHNIQELAANSRMTLVSDFGETVGTITGDTFTVGSGLQGEGAASLSGTDLVFTAKTGAESLTPTEATHETVMAMEAGTAVVAAGREYVDSAVEGLGLVSNMAPDGTSTFASMGGGVGRYKTGSHVDTHTWNAVVAVGSKREHKKGSLEWGVFAEYGRGNYTLHDDNGGRGDGNTHYAGGGLLAKWTNKHDVYTEASFRMGRMSDSASNMLRDVLGNTYGYDVHANYFGGHVGLGKIYKVKGNKDLDVYGKFFYTRRNGVDFDAGGNHYSLDSVASKLLRIGARYGSNDRKWNWYGGLAYEYEFGGESKGTVDGLAIRSASIKGASVRGEIGVRLEATKTNPWKADISIYGYGGKHRGIGGTVSVAYMF